MSRKEQKTKTIFFFKLICLLILSVSSSASVASSENQKNDVTKTSPLEHNVPTLRRSPAFLMANVTESPDEVLPTLEHVIHAHKQQKQTQENVGATAKNNFDETKTQANDYNSHHGLQQDQPVQESTDENGKHDDTIPNKENDKGNNKDVVLSNTSHQNATLTSQQPEQGQPRNNNNNNRRIVDVDRQESSDGLSTSFTTSTNAAPTLAIESSSPRTLTTSSPALSPVPTSVVYNLSNTTDVSPTIDITTDSKHVVTSAPIPRLKSVELITRKPVSTETNGSGVEGTPEKKKRRKSKNKSTKNISNENPVLNDGPSSGGLLGQNAIPKQGSWSHLPDKHHTEKWSQETDSSATDGSNWRNAFTVTAPLPPDFKLAKLEWGKYWFCHIYSTGGIFIFLTIINLWHLLSKLFSSTTLLLTKGRFTFVVFLMLTACSLRSVYLIVDPYNSESSYPPELIHLVADLPLLCIATCFAIIFLSLLNLTCVRLTSKNLQNNCVLALIVILVSSACISFDVYSDINPSRGAFHVISMIIFIVWTSMMALSYIIVFKDIHRSAVRRHSESLRATFTKLHIEGADLPRKLPKPTLRVSVKVTLIISLLLLALNGIIIYGLVAIPGIFHTMFAPKKTAEPWPWWSHQLVLRMVEITLCILITYTASLPQTENDDRSEDSSEHHPGFCSSCFPCCRRNHAVHGYESCSDIAYGFRNENFNTSLDFSNVPTATQRSHQWSRSNIPAPVTFHGRSEENTARSHNRNSLLSNPIQAALSSLGSKHSKFATNSTVESSQKHATILFRDKLRKSAQPAEPVPEVTRVEEAEEEGDDESIRARMGSRVHSICEEEAVLLHSPYFPRFKRSHCSSLDNSIDVSSDHLSSVGQSAVGVEYIPHHHRRNMAGSTCSSESAANSFDVAFFLNSNPHLDQAQAVAAQREFMERIVRHEQERHMKRTTQEDRIRFLEEYERIQEEIRSSRARSNQPMEPRSISPIVCGGRDSMKDRCASIDEGIEDQRHMPSQRTPYRSVGLHQYHNNPRNHHHMSSYVSSNQNQSHSCASSTQHLPPPPRSLTNDINHSTPEHLPNMDLDDAHHRNQHQNHISKLSLDLAPSGVVGVASHQHPRAAAAISQYGQLIPTNLSNAAPDQDITPDSAVYLDLHMSPNDTRDLHMIHNSFNSLKRASRSFLNRINSTFSLSNNSYAPLESADECVTYFGVSTMDKGSNGQRLRSARSADMLSCSNRINCLQHGDSGLLVEENSQRSSVTCDSACQTESETLCT